MDIRPFVCYRIQKDSPCRGVPVCLQYEYSLSRVLFCRSSSNHLSRHAITDMFKRHNPEDQRAASSLPYSVLLQMGFT